MGTERFKRHLQPCPHCGKEILDHLDSCPHCKQPVTSRYAKPMDPKRAKQIKTWLTVIGLVVIALVLYQRFMD